LRKKRPIIITITTTIMRDNRVAIMVNSPERERRTGSRTSDYVTYDDPGNEGGKYRNIGNLDEGGRAAISFVSRKADLKSLFGGPWRRGGHDHLDERRDFASKTLRPRIAVVADGPHFCRTRTFLAGEVKRA
jgi:hypothetical protein